VSEVKTAVFDGGEMEYISFGRGKKTFVILPGLSVHSVMGLRDAVEKAYAAFTEEYTVYLFDNTKNMGEGYTISSLADDTASAMKALGLADADVLGVSMGGMRAIYLSSRHPELVHKLILASTAARMNDTFLSFGQELLEKAEKKDEEGLLPAFADYVYSEKSLSLYRKAFIDANRGITDEEYSRLRILIRACLGYDASEELKGIKCPVLVIGSEGDRVVTAEASREIASALGCRLHLYDSSYGHAVYDEAPDYKERCLKFLNDSD
jgi:3-oxoadipate enol-lactonase